MQLAQLGQHLVQPLALDELHDVVMQPVLLADAVDGHDVGVVQPGGGLGLPMEAPQPLRLQQGVRRQHLQGDVAPQRFLLGFVHHAHAAAADLAQDAVVAESLQLRYGGAGLEGAGDVAGGGADALHQHQARKEIADIVGQVGAARMNSSRDGRSPRRCARTNSSAKASSGFTSELDSDMTDPFSRFGSLLRFGRRFLQRRLGLAAEQ